MVLGDDSSPRRARELLQVPVDPLPPRLPGARGVSPELSGTPSADMRLAKPGNSSRVEFLALCGGEHLVEATDLMMMRVL